MELEEYKNLVAKATTENIICTLGKTTVFQFDDCIIVASNKLKHLAVITNDIRIISKIRELKAAGYRLPYNVSARNDKFCFTDSNNHVVYKLSWMVYAIYKKGDYEKNIEIIRQGRIVFRRKHAEWDLRRNNLAFSNAKNPKLRVLSLLKKDIQLIGGLIAPDEEFRSIKGESAVWISNYGRVISKRKGKPRLLQPILNKSKNPDANQYWRLYLPQTIRGKHVKRCYYIHRLVAETFLDIPDWIKENDLLDIHHIRKIRGNEYDPMINSYKNLMFIPRKIHAAVDSISEIAVRVNSVWKKMDFIQASNYYGLTPYNFMEAIGNEKYKVPDRIRGKYQYYRSVVTTDDGNVVSIDVRIVRTRDKEN